MQEFVLRAFWLLVIIVLLYGCPFAIPNTNVSKKTKKFLKTFSQRVNKIPIPSIAQFQNKSLIWNSTAMIAEWLLYQIPGIFRYWSFKNHMNYGGGGVRWLNSLFLVWLLATITGAQQHVAKVIVVSVDKCSYCVPMDVSLRRTDNLPFFSKTLIRQLSSLKIAKQYLPSRYKNWTLQQFLTKNF